MFRSVFRSVTYHSTECLLFRKYLSSANGNGNVLKILSAAKSIPHPEKKRGEDAFFMNDCSFGVADGVGGWREHGVDPGEFSRTLVEKMGSLITKPVADANDLKWKAVAASQSTSTSVRLGSSTLCAVALGMNNGAFFYNIGDSGLYLFRFGQQNDQSSSKEWYIRFTSPKQCHSFNFPFQLGRGADSPMTGVSEVLEVQKGDICLVSSDGLLDNMFPSDLISLLNEHWKDGFPQSGAKQNLQEMVNLIVSRTFKNSLGKSLTPFAQEATSNGYKYQGGKPDDITAVLSLFLYPVFHKHIATGPIMRCLPVVVIITKETTSAHINIFLFLLFFLLLLLLSRSSSSRSIAGSSSGSTSTRSGKDIHQILSRAVGSENSSPVISDLVSRSLDDQIKVLLLVPLYILKNTYRNLNLSISTKKGCKGHNKFLLFNSRHFLKDGHVVFHLQYH